MPGTWLLNINGVTLMVPCNTSSLSHSMNHTFVGRLLPRVTTGLSVGAVPNPTCHYVFCFFFLQFHVFTNEHDLYVTKWRFMCTHPSAFFYTPWYASNISVYCFLERSNDYFNESILDSTTHVIYLYTLSLLKMNWIENQSNSTEQVGCFSRLQLTWVWPPRTP